MFLPTDESTFSISVKGDITKETYEGSFTVKSIMTNGQVLAVAQAIDRQGGYSPTMPAGYKSFIQAIEELNARVIDSPKWWKTSRGGRDLVDTNVVIAVWTECLKAESEYTLKLSGAAAKVEEATKVEENKKPTGTMGS